MKSYSSTLLAHSINTSIILSVLGQNVNGLDESVEEVILERNRPLEII